MGWGLAWGPWSHQSSEPPSLPPLQIHIFSYKLRLTTIAISISEISPPTERGVLMSAFQVVIQATALVGFWAAYAANAVVRDTSNLQWQIPVGLQLIPGIILLLGIVFIKETPHYLAASSSIDNVQESLAWLRGRPSTDPQIVAEARSIFQSVQASTRTQQLRRTNFIHEAIRNPIRKRLLIGIGLFIAQNATGMNALNYFVPLIFIRIADSISGALFLTGIFGVVKLISAFIYMFYCVRVRSNRFWLLGGTAVCAACMVVLGYCASGGDGDTGATVPPTSLTAVQAVLAVASVYLFAVAFGVSLGPIAWNVCAEIFPSHLNAQCCAVTTCTQWLCQILVAAATPILLAKIGTMTFVVFGACTVLGLVFCWACVPETRGVAVGKDMAMAFGQEFKDEDDDRAVIEEIEDVACEETPLLQDQMSRRRRSSVAIVV